MLRNRLAKLLIDQLVKHGYLDKVEHSIRYPVGNVIHERTEYQIRGPVVVTRDTERGQV